MTESWRQILPISFAFAVRARPYAALGLAASLSAVAVSGCGEESETEIVGPQVVAIEKSELVVGETVRFAGHNFLAPADGVTQLVFQGTYVYTDDEGRTIQEAVSPVTVTPLYDGEFTTPGTLGEAKVEAGMRMLRWNRFGPFDVPFAASGNRPGTFKGTLTAINVHNDGTEQEAGPGWPIALEVKPSVVIRKLEPVVGRNADGSAQTAECGAPALRGLDGLPYVIEVEAIGIDPKFWVYDLSGVNGHDDWQRFQHQADGQIDRLGDPAWHSDEIVVFNRIADDTDSSIASIRITAIDENNNTVSTALPFHIVRPLQFHHDGKRELAEYMEPEVVHGPIVGGIGTSVSYAESHSESRQRAVSVSVTSNWSQAIGSSQLENWSEGFGTTSSQSKTNSVGQTHSEGATSSDTYGVSYSNSETNKVDMSSTNGTQWGWNKSQGKSQEEFQQEMGQLFGSVSQDVGVEVSGEGSVPGLAKVGGKVSSKTGVTVGASQGNTTGERVGTSESFGSSATESESETTAFGSATTDSQSQNLSGTYAVASQNTINNTASETDATSESVTYSLGGSQGITENFSIGESETWSETWVTTENDTQLLQFSGKVPNGRCAVIYRQTVRYVRRAQLYSYDLCGVREHAGEMYFNEWTWSPNIVIGDNCESDLPSSTLPSAQCFIACD